MKFTTTLLTLTLTLGLTLAQPPFDPSGAKNVGNGAAGQFIGGQCLSDADCGSGCCANPTGICSGVGAQNQAGKTGCGFGGGASAAAAAPANSAPAPAGSGTGAGAASNNAGGAGAGAGTGAASAAAPVGSAAAGTASAGGPAFDPSGVKNVGNGAGTQFIGGQCLSQADCASGCCAGPSGICSGVGAQTQAGKTGCGFVSQKKLMRF